MTWFESKLNPRKRTTTDDVEVTSYAGSERDMSEFNEEYRGSLTYNRKVDTYNRQMEILSLEGDRLDLTDGAAVDRWNAKLRALQAEKP